MRYNEGHQSDRMQRPMLGPPRFKQPRASFKPPQPNIPRQRQSYMYANRNPQRQSVEMIQRELHDLHQKDKPFGHTQRRKTMNSIFPFQDEVIMYQLQSVQQKKTKPDNYNKDYLRLSQEYKLMERYRSNTHLSKSSQLHTTLACLGCQRRGPDKVLFPCEHACICSSCLKSSLPKCCPLCKEVIQEWCDEVRSGSGSCKFLVIPQHMTPKQSSPPTKVKPAISTKFLQQFFIESKNAIRTEILNRTHNIEDCFDSIADEEAPKPKRGSGIFSCWRILFARRPPSYAPEGIDHDRL